MGIPGLGLGLLDLFLLFCVSLPITGNPLNSEASRLIWARAFSFQLLKNQIGARCRLLVGYGHSGQDKDSTNKFSWTWTKTAFGKMRGKNSQPCQCVLVLSLLHEECASETGPVTLGA